MHPSHIADAFQSQASAHYDNGCDIQLTQNVFLTTLKRSFPSTTPQQICADLKAINCLDLYTVLEGLTGNPELKSLPKLHTALLLLTSAGLSEKEALARTAKASDEEILNPAKILHDSLPSSSPENNPHGLKALAL